MSSAKFLFKWRSRVLSEDGPKSPTTRYVLLALSAHMNNQGTSCWPSIDTMAVETKLSRKAVWKHLKSAVEDGWLKRWMQATGRSWKRYNYEAQIPDGGVPRTGPNTNGDVRGSIPNGNGGVPEADGGVPRSTMVAYQGRTNSSRNSTKNSSRAVTERARRRSVPLGYEKEVARQLGIRELKAKSIGIEYLNDGGDPGDLDGLLEYARGKES